MLLLDLQLRYDFAAVVWRRIATYVLGLLMIPIGAYSEVHGHDESLHFAHPLFSESPSPDTKLRADYIFSSIGGDPEEKADVHTMRLEAEIALRPWISIEANIPVTVRDPKQGAKVNHLDTVEVGLKLATFALAEHGVLLGGGIEFGFPTGSDGKEIGSSHVLEVEPFIDVGFKRDALEIVGFLSPAIPTREKGDDEADVELGWSVSFLYHVDERVTTLLELNGEHVFGGEEAGHSAVGISPGIKLSPAGDPNLNIAFGVTIPVSDDKEFDVRTIVSVFYHY
jgi:hypothetical protein